MPTPRLDDATIEFSFTPEELRMAKLLDPLKIAYLQTLYAQDFKTRASVKLPVAKELEMSYILECAELDGRMSAIQTLLDNHKLAMQEVIEAQGTEQSGVAKDTETGLAERASTLVNRIQTN